MLYNICSTCQKILWLYGGIRFQSSFTIRWELEDKNFLKIDIICLDDILKNRIMAIKTNENFIPLSNVSVKSKLQHALPGQPPGHLTFLKIIVQIPPYPGQNAVQMPHTRVHSGDQMPPPRGHFAGTKDRRTAETPSVVEQNLYKYSK